MNRIYLVMVIGAMVGQSIYGSPGTSIYNLYSDHRAMRIDDILTVMIVEQAKAGSESKTNTCYNV
ncbi:MAG TPA: flagellar basal body L-ring protein FlgH [Chitinispirillaceae bacterium]|nr:flagellar basal body L-ring protein FlgH [Chitinispirillaceae bacterium]